MTYAQAVPLMDVAFSHPIKLIVNALGPPPPDMIERAHSNGVLVGALAGKKAHAVRHVASGVDIIIAQGHEAGGHTGDIGTMVLVPEIVDAVAPTPVLAAGGIGSGRQVAASMALGAQGVWCGSVWLTTLEAETHPVVKEKFLGATSSDTLRSRSRTGKPARQLRSAWTDEWEGESSPGTLPMPLQPMLIAQASRQVDRAAMNPENKGAVELSNYFVGQIVGSMNESISATRAISLSVPSHLSNNVAELAAIFAAIRWLITNPCLLTPGPISVVYDSTWASATVRGLWRPRRNVKAVLAVRNASHDIEALGFSLRWLHTKSHQGHVF